MSIERAIPTLAPESLRCRDVMPTVRCISSRDVGWRSLLIDVHSGVSSQNPYTPVRTPDPRVAGPAPTMMTSASSLGGIRRRTTRSGTGISSVEPCMNAPHGNRPGVAESRGFWRGPHRGAIARYAMNPLRSAKQSAAQRLRVSVRTNAQRRTPRMRSPTSTWT